MDKLIVKNKYLKDVSHFVSRGQIIKHFNLTLDKDPETGETEISRLANKVMTVGYVPSPGGFLPHAHPWWDTETNSFTTFWYTTDSKTAINEYYKVLTPEFLEKYRQHGWDISTPIHVEYNKKPAEKKEKFLKNIKGFENHPAGCSIRSSDGIYYIHNDRIEFWDNDGTILSACNSEINYWLWTFMIQKHSHISQRFAFQDWCETLENNKYNFYHETRHPTTETPTIDKLLDKEGIIEFIDQVHLLCPHMKKMRPDYIVWPTKPFKLEHRFKDSKGYYWVFYADQWELSAEAWTANQLDYLDKLLDELQLEKTNIMDYAKQQWTIIG
jgi:hypothetical protein